MLTDAQLKRAKLTPAFLASVKVAKRTDFPDHAVPGLVLRVTPNGVKTWCLRYRDSAGRTKRYTLGSVAGKTLDKARKEARAKLHAIAAGEDPARDKREARDSRTVGAMAKDFLEQRSKTMRRNTMRHDEGVLNLHVLQTWQHRKAKDITRRDVRDCLEVVVSRGYPIMANHVLSTIRKLFNFGIKRDWVEHNPAARMDPPAVEVSRSRVLNDDEIRLVWRLFDQEPPLLGAWWKLRLLTAQRGGELANLRWSDIEEDQYGWAFTIPAETAKNGRAHRVPMSKSVQEIIAKIPRVNEWVFPGRNGRMAPALFDAAGTRMRDRMTAIARLSDPHANADFRGHDLRRTAATLMAKAGIPPSHISRVLNHAEKGPRATQIYQRYEFDKEKRIALETLEREILRVLSDQPQSGTVVPMARR